MKKKTAITHIQTITYSAMMIAMSVAIGIFCKTILNFSGGLLRVTFENIPIIMSGIIYGPAVGCVVGILSDIISYLLSGQSYPLNLIVTLGAAAIGLISGFVSSFIIKKRGIAQIVLSGALAHLVGSMIIKPIGLFQFYQWLVLLRLPLYCLAIAPLEIFLICLLYKKSGFRKIIEQADKVYRKTEHQNQISRGIGKMTYDEALEYIHGVNKTFCKPGLERIEELCEALGHPERGMKFIHVAGTNGKGSTSSMLSNVLIKAGYNVGLYTSPYIYRFNERIRINGEDIGDLELASLCEKLKPITDGMADKPTEFELITAIAFEHFKNKKCDVVVLEVGMGGRFDSTNVIRDPLLSIITGISLDHVAFLGDTTEKIAFEKAGIIKDGAPVIFGGEDEGARSVIEGIANERGCALYSPDYKMIENSKTSLEGGEFDYGKYKNVKLSLLGEYQLRNASLVLCALDILKERGLKIDTGAIYDGIFATKWRARFEIIHRDPTVIFDGAHNAEGISAAVESIKKYYPEGGVSVMTGVLSDKDYFAIAKSISSVADTAFTITPDNPRALGAEEYAKVLSDLGVSATACTSIGEALKRGMEYARGSGKPLFCLGSIYTYSSVIDEIEKLG